MKVIVSVLFCAFARGSIGQQPATPASILAGVVTGMGGANAQTVTLNGTSELFAGSNNDTGSFTANCSISGSSQLAVQLSSYSFTETILNTNGIPSGSWVDSSGVQHPMAQHNLYTPASWFCPVVALAQVLSTKNLTVQFIGNEEKNGATLAHYTTIVTALGTGGPTALLTHLSQLDIFLNPQTLMPVVFDFNIHPDNNAGTDIPIEITFTNYTQVNGVWIPFTVERYVNSTLSLQLQVASATPASTGSTSQ
jgi:hypothetical protein